MPESIVFMDCSLSSIVCAHMALDESSDVEVHMVTDLFEVGMYGETPGIISESGWPIGDDHWLSKTGFNRPSEDDTAIRSSWLKKSMAISLAHRGAHFHTGTRTTEVDSQSKEVILSYPGGKRQTRIQFDHLVTTRLESDKVWRGAITASPPPSESISGRRPDGTYEMWWLGDETPENPLQLMEWVGHDPRTALTDAVTLAVSKLTNIKK